jgi:hypothetical protein
MAASSLHSVFAIYRRAAIRFRLLGPDGFYFSSSPIIKDSFQILAHRITDYVYRFYILNLPRLHGAMDNKKERYFARKGDRLSATVS